MYRPPSGIVNIFFEFIENMLEYCTQLSVPVIFSGDFNIDLLFVNQSRQTFLDVFLSSGYENVINVPTGVISISETLLDLCFTNYQVYGIEAGLLISAISDHLPIFLLFTSHSARPNRPDAPTPIIYRAINEDTITPFK